MIKLLLILNSLMRHKVIINLFIIFFIIYKVFIRADDMAVSSLKQRSYFIVVLFCLIIIISHSAPWQSGLFANSKHPSGINHSLSEAVSGVQSPSRRGSYLSSKFALRFIRVNHRTAATGGNNNARTR